MQHVAEIMAKSPLLTIEPSVRVAQALRLIGEHDVSHLIVIEGQTLLGVVCICDLDGADSSGVVSACMSASPLAIDADANVVEAARCMIDHGVSCLPVMRAGAVAGVVTASDLRRAGVLERSLDHCAACGSSDHVRSAKGEESAGFCLECTRRSVPPDWDEEVGGNG